MPRAATATRLATPISPATVSRATLRAVRLATPSRLATPLEAAQVLGPRPADIGQPVLQVLATESGGVVLSLSFATSYMAFVMDSDLAGIRRIFAEMAQTAASLSQGPYSLQELAAMGHPYATRHKSKAPAQALRRNKAIGHVKGTRGSVPTFLVVNKQSGELASSWAARVERQDDGVIGHLENSAEHAAYVLLGTDTMKAHGPLLETGGGRRYITNLYLARLNGEWARVVTTAWQRAQKPRRRGA